MIDPVGDDQVVDQLYLVGATIVVRVDEITVLMRALSQRVQEALETVPLASIQAIRHLRDRSPHDEFVRHGLEAGLVQRTIDLLQIREGDIITLLHIRAKLGELPLAGRCAGAEVVLEPGEQAQLVLD